MEKITAVRKKYFAFSPAFFLFCILCLLHPALGEKAQAAEGTRVYFFWSTGCPHCEAEKDFLDRLQKEHPSLEVLSFEIRQNRENALLFTRMTDAYGIKVKGVPATFIGAFEPVIGFSSDQTTGSVIRERVLFCIEHGCPDPRTKTDAPPLNIFALHSDLQGAFPQEPEAVCPQEEKCPEEEKAKPSAGGLQKSGEETADPIRSPETEAEKEAEQEDIIVLPLVGEVDLRQTSLPYQTLIIAGLDSFNPCAFFVLFTLLGLLVHVQSRRRVLLIGGIFVFFSGFIYFIFMAAWLNFFLLSGEIAAVTAVAGVIALIIALINIKDFFYFRKGVSLSIPDSAKPKLFDRMRRLMKASSFPSIILGTVVLAVAANTYELFCTAGFPMVFTRMLTLQNLSQASYYLYLALYNVIYVIPLGTIVVIISITLGAKKLSEWQGQVLKLVSGMMMLGLGAVLLLRPELLNNLLVTAGLLAASLASSAVIIGISKWMKGRPA